MLDSPDRPDSQGSSSEVSTVSATSTIFFLGLAMPTWFLRLPKPCSRTAGSRSVLWRKGLHSVESKRALHSTVKRAGAYHDPRSSKLEAGAPSSGEEAAHFLDQRLTQTTCRFMYHFRGYCGVAEWLWSEANTSPRTEAKYPV